MHKYKRVALCFVFFLEPFNEASIDFLLHDTKLDLIFTYKTH